MSAWDLARLPLRAAIWLIKLMFVPAAAIALAWWIFGPGSTVFTVVTLFFGGWAAVMFWLWLTKIRGVLRSLERGSFSVRGPW